MEYASRFMQRASRVRQRASRQLLADLALLLVTAVWGGTFVMVKDAVAGFPVFSFMAIRFAIAVLALLPFLLRLHTSALPPLRITAPLFTGFALFAGYAFQTAGLRLTTPAKAGFITGLSVVIVPVAAALLFRKPPDRSAWTGVGLAVAGLALLTLRAGLHMEPGDLLVSGCAISFAAHILLTGYFAPHSDPLWLTFGQILTVAILSGIAALVLEQPFRAAILTSSVLLATAFTGVLATSFAFGIQTAAQRFTTSTHTALIFAAEPVFAGLFSFLLIGELLGPQQAVGCGLILAGMVVSELRGAPERSADPARGLS